MGDHTEAIAVDFDPTIISYAEIMKVVWQSHHPLKNFGGRQYRNAIWYHNEEQKQAAEDSRQTTATTLGVETSVVQTALEPAGHFTYAEDYHQKYALRRQSGFIGELEGLFDGYVPFTDSTITTKLNGWFGNDERSEPTVFAAEVADFGLPGELEEKVLRDIGV